MDEKMAQDRMIQIINEFSQCREMDSYDLSLEAMEHGDVKVVISKPKVTFERIIKFKEPLDFITDTFGYPATITPTSKDIALNGLKMAYFNSWGDLVVEHEDSTEEFRVQPKHRDKVTANLKEKLGNKFKN